MTHYHAWVIANGDDPEAWRVLESTLEFFATDRGAPAVVVTAVDRLTTDPELLARIVRWRVVEPYALLVTRDDEVVVRIHTPLTRRELRDALRPVVESIRADSRT